jgi:hypothetical protein
VRPFLPHRVPIRLCRDWLVLGLGLLSRASQETPPSPYKDYQRPGTDLARSRDEQRGEFWQTLSGRTRTLFIA